MKKLMQVSALTAAVLALVSLAACSSTQFATHPPNDAALTSHVKARLSGDHEVTGSDINVAVKNRFVTLSGTVLNQKEQQEAVKIAGRTDFIRGHRSRAKPAIRIR
jgi:predicted outer membrane protein